MEGVSPFKPTHSLKFECEFFCQGCGRVIEVRTLQVVVDSATGQPVTCKVCGEKYSVVREGAIHIGSLPKHVQRDWPF